MKTNITLKLDADLLTDRLKRWSGSGRRSIRLVVGRSLGSAKGSIFIGHLSGRGTNSMSDRYLVGTKILMYGHDQVYGGVRVVNPFIPDKRTT